MMRNPKRSMKVEMAQKTRMKNAFFFGSLRSKILT